MNYAELHCISNFSFLRGASRPEELVNQAAKMGYEAIAITDECSLAGVVKAYNKVEELKDSCKPIKLIIGSEFLLPDRSKLVALVPDKLGYEELSAFITLCRRRSDKGEYQLLLHDLTLHLQHCFIIFLPNLLATSQQEKEILSALHSHKNIWIGIERFYNGSDEACYQNAYRIATLMNKPMVACGNVHMHVPQRKSLQDTLTAIRKNSSIQDLGRQLYCNSEHYLKPINKLLSLYPKALLQESVAIANRCSFSLKELRYQYPSELIPPTLSATHYLRQLVDEGADTRWHGQVPDDICQRIDAELEVIEELSYEYYFLTVHDLVSFAKQQGILCQGRGSAANSVVCYCLFITEVNPSQTELLFERFISKERNEPPDIDVDFEHERREEVIQYIYKKYTRERAALTATLITYRTRSAIRDVGKALGINPQLLTQLSQSLGWWHKPEELEQRLAESGMTVNNAVNDKESDRENDARPSMAKLFIQLVDEILGFPRHLSQHVGGFIISNGPLSRLVPVENASMPERTVIQWDKEDIESLGLLKVDVLGLGMLSAIRKMLALASTYLDSPLSLASIPDDDPDTYDLLCQGDSIGVFQVESRAQISMLPRLKPRCYYDLVIQVAIVRPGPIQGNMVHPFLRRRDGIEPISYDNEAIRGVLSRTLGVPIFQEQVIKLAMVAAGFSGGEADQLRRAMASWGKNGNLLGFRDKLVNGMRQRGYDQDFAERLFEQMKGFGSYGFPESHAASFALLVYVSAWLKCHHPTAFYAALINSQPMGFYSNSQLVQDARRHQIDVRPIDIRFSEWDCSLEAVDNHHAKPYQSPGQTWALRLGFRLIKGFQQETAERIIACRQSTTLNNLAALVHSAKLQTRDRELLIRANATQALSGNRHQSHWQNLAVDWDALPLDTANSDNTVYHSSKSNDNIFLNPPTEVQDINADYNHTGLTLQRHPMQVLRTSYPFSQCKRCMDLQTLNHGRFVKVAGIVTGRQRPGTASGVIFVTLEDETGNINVIVWKDLQQRYRQVLLKSKLLMIKGVMERKHSVVHIIAGQLIDCSEHLASFVLPSRDFH